MIPPELLRFMMPEEKTQIPSNFTEYCDWAKEVLAVDYADPKIKTFYDTNTSIALTGVQQSSFYSGLQDKLNEIADAYKASYGAQLFMVGSVPTLQRKPYRSFIDKSFRVNILWNRKFPNPPKLGWITPLTCFTKMNDLIRATITCKYVDGPKHVANSLTDYARTIGTTCNSYTQQRDEGYYAYHFYSCIPINLLDQDWKEIEQLLNFELQLSTQLQDSLKDITHVFYEKERTLGSANDQAWKWELKSPKFRTSYISHSLHLLEAIIVELRDAALREDGGSDD